MYFDVKLSLFALIFFIAYHNIHAMEPGGLSPRGSPSPKASSRQNSSGSFESSSEGETPRKEGDTLRRTDPISKKLGSTPPTLQRRKGSLHLANTFLRRKSISESGSSPNSPKIDKPQHVIWLFGQDNIPLKCITIGEVGTTCSEKLMDTLKDNFISTFFGITTDDITSLNQDCGGELTYLFKYSNIQHIPSSKSPKIDNIFRTMVTCIKNNNGSCLYGVSTNNRLFLVLAYWSIIETIQFALERNDLIQIYNHLFTFHQILFSPQLWHFATDYIMKIVLKRIIPEEVKRNQFIMDDTDNARLNNYCESYLKAYMSKTNYPSPDLPDLEEQQ